MRIAVVDIGTNSTRLLIADVGDGTLTELEKRSTVTRLGEGLEASGELGDAPQQRVIETLHEYNSLIERHRAQTRVAVMTSAVRDANNGVAFADTVRGRFGLDGRTLSGDEEARLSFLGATAARPADEGPLLVIDIGGGSTEMIVGSEGAVEFHVSTQVGVVRHTERHVTQDPPQPEEMQALAADARATIEQAVPDRVRSRVDAAVAVAGTATSTAAISAGVTGTSALRVVVSPAPVTAQVMKASTFTTARARAAAAGSPRRRSPRSRRRSGRR